ncbi:MAG TPA: type II toxin-antitoxin system RelE/ParE family toxin [Saprospiraceae bacterium]|nr:type II toxin-antitoxin system RelE/ParE family toxin [Saprospiraceae bacterium]
MIKSFADVETERIWKGGVSSKLPVNIQQVARRKLRMINNAQDLQDLTVPPANRLEKLSGSLKGFYSIRVNLQWRVIFSWTNGNAFDVKIIDYH